MNNLHVQVLGLTLLANLAPQQTEYLTPPTRDPKTFGYVEARELPNGQNPPATEDGNFVIGPTHEPATPAQATVMAGKVLEFTMDSSTSKIYPGIARDPDTFGTVDPADPAKLRVTTSHPASYSRAVAVYIPPHQATDAVVAQTLPEALEYIWRDYRAPTKD